MRLRTPRLYVNSPQRKRLLIREAKSKPCPDCLAEGRRADWPLAAMTLDHLGKKKMDFAGTRGVVLRRTGIPLSPPHYQTFTAAEIIRELSTCEAICANHQNIRTRARLLARDPEAEDEDDEDDEGEIALF